MCRFSIIAAIVLVVPWSASGLAAQNARGLTGKKPMTGEEYALLLNRVDHDLIGWRAELSAIDPGRGSPSYETGKQIEAEKQRALDAVNIANSEVSRLRTKKTIYQELALADSVDSISFFFAQLSFLGAFNDVSMTSVNKSAAELSAVEIVLKNDGMERLRLLESGSCGETGKP